mmetsp:Transcript_43674/g.104160  ORF Transcript_43674/g.104160 Transcript_43674/m.104160 type:complete len:365 (-) Transcript_43674:16-1110(-)
MHGWRVGPPMGAAVGGPLQGVEGQKRCPDFLPLLADDHALVRHQLTAVEGVESAKLLADGGEEVLDVLRKLEVVAAIVAWLKAGPMPKAHTLTGVDLHSGRALGWHKGQSALEALHGQHCVELLVCFSKLLDARAVQEPLGCLPRRIQQEPELEDGPVSEPVHRHASHRKNFELGVLWIALGPRHEEALLRPPLRFPEDANAVALHRVIPAHPLAQRHLGVGVVVEKAHECPTHGAEKHRAKAHDIPRGRILRHGLARGDERLRTDAGPVDRELLIERPPHLWADKQIAGSLRGIGHGDASQVKLDEVPAPRAAAVQQAGVGPGHRLRPAFGGQQLGHGLEPLLHVVCKRRHCASVPRRARVFC